MALKYVPRPTLVNQYIFEDHFEQFVKRAVLGSRPVSISTWP